MVEPTKIWLIHPNIFLSANRKKTCERVSRRDEHKSVNSFGSVCRFANWPSKTNSFPSVIREKRQSGSKVLRLGNVIGGPSRHVRGLREPVERGYTISRHAPGFLHSTTATTLQMPPTLIVKFLHRAHQLTFRNPLINDVGWLCYWNTRT